MPSVNAYVFASSHSPGDSHPDEYRAEGSRLFWVFLGAVGCLYAISCANAVNLMLVRTVTRRRELGVRLALGGSRVQLVRLLIAESMVLTSWLVRWDCWSPKGAMRSWAT